jgi:hypothetical protein
MGESGTLALGVFMALCQGYSGKFRALGRDGAFVRSDGSPMKPWEIAALIRLDEKIVETATEILTSEDIHWLEWVACKPKRKTETPVIQTASEVIQTASEVITTTGERRGEERRREEDSTHEDSTHEERGEDGGDCPDSGSGEVIRFPLPPQKKSSREEWMVKRDIKEAKQEIADIKSSSGWSSCDNRPNNPDDRERFDLLQSKLKRLYAEKNQIVKRDLAQPIA